MRALAASPEVLVFTALGVAAVVHALACALRVDRHARQFYDWVLETHPDAPRQLSRLHRWLPSRRVRPAALRRQRIVVGPEFEARYAAIRRLERTQLVSACVAACAVAVVLFGVRFWGWWW